jgi:hypothetical protein
VRLAEQVFAPHYAQPMACLISRATPLLSKPEGGEPVAELTAGTHFELLELAGRYAWGIAPGPGLVGYCDRTALELA